MKNILLVLVVACLVFAATPCQAQDESKHTAVFNQQWLKGIVSIEVLDAQGKGTPIGTGFLLETPNKHIASLLPSMSSMRMRGRGHCFRTSLTVSTGRMVKAFLSQIRLQLPNSNRDGSVQKRTMLHVV